MVNQIESIIQKTLLIAPNTSTMLYIWQQYSLGAGRS